MTGIAINALAGAIIGSLILLASASELRDQTFWSLGSLNGANGETVTAALVGIAPALFIAKKLRKPLDAWLLGKVEATHLGAHGHTQILSGRAGPV